MLLRGACHCRNISFTLAWVPDPAEIVARVCGCSFCTKHGGVWTACPTGELRVAVEDPAQVSLYAFATRTATFHVCARCGVVPLVTSEIAGRIYAVVSATVLDVDPALVRRVPASFDDESLDDRLARRARGWIANVEGASVVR
jgi:hypothetical protein